ncbi:hypothetical protein ACFQQB_33920 [Nonomuraea rubra]|uniref:SbtR family transcriptional regulator n=1 Tax=Nonomuraea rubra TaxID=46180 RepID=UPI003614CA69
MTGSARGRPLLERTQATDLARTDVTSDDVLFLVNGISGTNFAMEAQRERVLTTALDGIRGHHSTPTG